MQFTLFFVGNHFFDLGHDSFDGLDGTASNLDLEFRSILQQAAVEGLNQFRGVGQNSKVLETKVQPFKITVVSKSKFCPLKSFVKLIKIVSII